MLMKLSSSEDKSGVFEIWKSESKLSDSENVESAMQEWAKSVVKRKEVVPHICCC